MKRIELTEREKEIVTALDHKMYTVGYLEEWINRNDNVFINAPAALNSMGAHGFYTAVKAIAAMDADKK